MTTPPTGNARGPRAGRDLNQERHLDHDRLAEGGEGGEMIRHEEELRTRVERYPAKRITMRKRAVEEEETITVRVRREEVEIVEEDLTIPEGEHSRTGRVGRRDEDLDADGGEIILYAERPVVTTEWVPVERVRLGRNTVREERSVTENVAREVVELVEERDPAFRADAPGETDRRY